MSKDLDPGPEAPGPAADARRGIQSVEVGGQLLRALAHHGRAMALKDLAREAGMPAAKAHPYLVSFGKIGLIAQEPDSGRYGLGPLALQLGLMSLQQVDPVREAAPLLPALAQRLGHTVALAVWGNRGATIVMIEASPAAVHVAMRRGTVFSVADTASGRLFAAWRPADEVRALYEDDRRARPLSADGTPLPPWRGFAQQLAEVRDAGLARTDSGVVPGVGALAAPVFDHRGRIVLAIVVIGPTAALDTRADGAAAAALREAAAAVSGRLGHRPDAPAAAAPPAAATD